MLRRDVASQLTLAAFLLLVGGLAGAGCAGGLPEADSEGAKLYVQYCSGEGCHGAIPPQRGGPGYWRNQYVRMIDLMKDQGWPLPDPGQEQKIRDYLERNAG